VMALNNPKYAINSIGRGTTLSYLISIGRIQSPLPDAARPSASLRGRMGLVLKNNHPILALYYTCKNQYLVKIPTYEAEGKKKADPFHTVDPLFPGITSYYCYFYSIFSARSHCDIGY